MPHTVPAHCVDYVARSVNVTRPQELLVRSGVRENGGAMNYSIDGLRSEYLTQFRRMSYIDLMFDQIRVFIFVADQVHAYAPVTLFQNVPLDNPAEESRAAGH
jgi:hypothetical protein